MSEKKTYDEAVIRLEEIVILNDEGPEVLSKLSRKENILNN